MSTTMTGITAERLDTLSFVELRKLASEKGCFDRGKNRQELIDSLTGKVPSESGPARKTAKKKRGKKREPERTPIRFSSGSTRIYDIRQANPHPSCAWSLFAGSTEIGRFPTRMRVGNEWQEIDGLRHAQMVKAALEGEQVDACSCKTCSTL